MRWIPEPKFGDKIDATRTMYPTQMWVVVGQDSDVYGHDHSTTYGVVVNGAAVVEGREEGSPSLALPAGSYFAVPGRFQIRTEHYDMTAAKTVLIERLGFRGQHAAGRLEPKGRLTYIDGCSDSMLVYPPRLGDPVLNHLHFPGDILQTQHTHPSIRMGVVVSGEGVAWRGEHGRKEDLRPFFELAGLHGLDKVVRLYEAWQEHGLTYEGTHISSGEAENELVLPHEVVTEKFCNIHSLYHLRAGGVFLLEEGELHSFCTPPGGHMEIVAYHPDTDWGPTDENHPMLNRTHINRGE